MEGFCGARSAIAFENAQDVIYYDRLNYLPDASTLTYEGLFSENFFKLQSLTDKEKDVEVSQAQVKNPITGEIEQYLGLLIKSKYDGVGLRLPIDLCVTVDISGSMGGGIGNSSMSRIDLAKKACNKLVKLLNKDDKFAFSTFNDQAQRIFPLTPGSELNQSHVDKINSINLCGGTYLYTALNDCYEIIKTSTNKNRRIIFITDLCDNCNDPNLINLFNKCASEGIYITVIGISYECSTSLAEVVTHTKGCNYFIAGKEEDLDKYLVHDFNYVCFPSGFDVDVEFKSNNLKITKSIGAGFNIPKEVHDKGKEWLIKTHKEESSVFKHRVNNLLLYFKRLKKKVPMPVLATFCNFLRYNKKTVCEVNTCFPSVLTKDRNDTYMEGGIILLKLNKENTVSDFAGELDLKFITLEGQKYVETYRVRFPNFMNNQDFYSDKNIQNALSYYFYAKWCRRMMKGENQSNKKKDKELFKKQVRDSSKEVTDNVKAFLKNNCDEYITKKKKSKYKKLDDLYKAIEANIGIEGKNEQKRKEHEEEKAKNKDKKNSKNEVQPMGIGF